MSPSENFPRSSGFGLWALTVPTAKATVHKVKMNLMNTLFTPFALQRELNTLSIYANIEVQFL